MWKTKAQNSRIHGLLNVLNIPKESKAEMIFSITKGRSSSAGDLTVDEADQVIKTLEEIKKKMPANTFSNDANSPENRMRRKLFAIAHEMNWRRDGKADRDRLLAWVEKYGYLHKPMSKYTAEELPRLITQFENVLRAYHAEGKV